MRVELVFMNDSLRSNPFLAPSVKANKESKQEEKTIVIVKDTILEYDENELVDVKA